MTGMTGTVGDSKMLTNGVMPQPMGMMGQTSIMVRFPKIRASQHHADVTTSPTVICTYRPWSRPRWQTLSEKFQTPQICWRGAMKEGKLCMRLLQPPIKLVSKAFKEDQTFRGTARGDVNCKLKIKSNFRKHRQSNQKLIFYFICHIKRSNIYDLSHSPNSSLTLKLWMCQYLGSFTRKEESEHQTWLKSVGHSCSV